MNISLYMYQTLAAAVAIFFLGGFLKSRIAFLRKYCIPAPVIGGTIFSIVNCILYTQGIWNYSQDTIMQNWCMNLFFTSIGYMASISLVRRGGILVLKMAALIAILITVQDIVGVSMAQLFGLNLLMGLADGSIPMVGGHGTAGSFGPVLESLGLMNGTTIAFAAATFGLVSGSLIGGPIGELLVRKYHLVSQEDQDAPAEEMEEAAASSTS